MKPKCNLVIHAQNNSNSLLGDFVSQQDSVYQYGTPEPSINGKKRTKLGLLIQILEHIRASDDTIISSIARHANMSHQTATRNCENLVKNELLLYDGKKYKITDKGLTFLNSCNNFEDFLTRFQLGQILYY